MIERPRYCEECRMYPRRCDGADCYYDYLEALEVEQEQNKKEQED